MAANAAVAIFALTYATLAQSRGVVLSIGAATLVWFAAAALLQSVKWTPRERACRQCRRVCLHHPAIGALPRRGAERERQAQGLRSPRCAPRRWPWSSRSSRLQAIGSAR